MSVNEGSSATPNDLEAKLTEVAYHEAGHVVIAAALELRLLSEGLMIDTAAGGLGCYCKEPGESDILRERVMVSAFAGCFAQNRFCEEQSYPLLNYFNIIWSSDWREARGIAIKLSNEYVAGRSILTIQEELERRSKQLVAENWPAIGAVADALLAKNWEPLRPLKSGSQWSMQPMAKYLSGEETVRVLELFGFAAVWVSVC